jgi:hypothetical protein
MSNVACTEPTLKDYGGHHGQESEEGEEGEEDQGEKEVNCSTKTWSHPDGV